MTRNINSRLDDLERRLTPADIPSAEQQRNREQVRRLIDGDEIAHALELELAERLECLPDLDDEPRCGTPKQRALARVMTDPQAFEIAANLSRRLVQIGGK